MVCECIVADAAQPAAQGVPPGPAPLRGAAGAEPPRTRNGQLLAAGRAVDRREREQDAGGDRERPRAARLDRFQGSATRTGDRTGARAALADAHRAQAAHQAAAATQKVRFFPSLLLYYFYTSALLLVLVL